MTLRGCPHCGLVQHVPNVEPGHEALCARCGDTVYRPDGMLSNRLCAAFALAALICYPLGVTLPVMRLEQLGHVRDASIWDGTVSLLTHGYIVIGLIVLICSVVVPILKVAGLFVLTARPAKLREHHQARVYRLIELAGRWGMVDVLLVAMVVAAVKLGDLVNVSPGPGVVAFTACVLLSVLASISFNPHAIWESGR